MVHDTGYLKIERVELKTNPQLHNSFLLYRTNSGTEFTKVFWDGREIGKTAVRRKTLNPVWFTEDNKESTIVVDTGSLQQTKPEQPYFWLEGAASMNPLLQVEVYDWDAVGSHDFLGGVELDLREVVELQRITLAKIRAHGGTSG